MMLRSWSSSTGAAAPSGTATACCRRRCPTSWPPTARISYSPSSPSGIESGISPSTSSDAPSISSSSSQASSVGAKEHILVGIVMTIGLISNNDTLRHGKDFTGGVFHFKEGEPSSVVPVMGDVLIYTADSRNVHSVDQVIDGERLTLTLWFTRDSAYDEDAKLIHLISQRLPNYDVFKPGTILPFPASDNMYWFPYEHLGFDIRCARMHMLGLHFCSFNAGTSEASVDTLELLSKPLRICRNDEMCENEFVNSLHALQVAQFYSWRAPELASARREMLDHQISTRLPPLRKASDSEMVLPCSHQLAETVFGHVSHDSGGEFPFTWVEFELAVKKWEDYMSALHKDFLSLVPYWISNQSITCVNPSELEKCNQEQR